MIFGEKIIEHKTYVLMFSTIFFFETFIILGRNERDIITNVYWPSSKAPVILSYFNNS